MEERPIIPVIPESVALMLGATLLLLLAIAEFTLPGEINPTAGYVVVVALFAWSRSRALVWTVAFLAVGLTYGGLLWGPSSGLVARFPTMWINRGIVALALLCTAAMAHFWIHFRNRLHRDGMELTTQHRELSQQDAEISRQNEELQSQTEELQSQTEELERQSEELRLANDELAERERTLQSMLDLARSLTAGLGQEQMLSRICLSLRDLINQEGAAAALVLRRGSDVHAVCHEGFGKGGPVPETWPFEESFSHLVMERNQAAFLVDAALRPDLLLPRGQSGTPMQSVLGAPVRLRGVPIGSLQVYAPHKHVWSEQEMILVESLAAQASISLESAELFEEIDRQRRQSETVLQTLPVGVIFCDAGYTNVRLNATAATMFDLPAEINLANFRQSWEIRDQSHPLPPPEHPLRRAVLEGKTTHNEELELAMGGNRRIVLMSAAPIQDREGRIIGGIAAFSDITAQKDLQRELEMRRSDAEQASMRKTRFLAAVSHDIRTPANAINLMAEVIRRAAGTPEMALQVPELARELRGSALNLVELVSDVLDVARFDSGKIELQESEFPLAELLAEEVRQMRPLAVEKDLVLELQPPAAPLWVRTDRIKLGRVIANLVGNAIKFTRTGQVMLGAERSGEGGCQVSIRDTGVGIQAEHLGHIFDEFYQLRNPERDRNKGTGLGLAISKRLIDAMGGRIEIRSTPGEGSIFTITLPPRSMVVTDRPPHESLGVPAGPNLPSRPRPMAGSRILLIEDHDITRGAVAQLLEGEGATVMQASDGRTGLRLLEEERPDVLLLDLMLPDIDGREILRRLQERRPSSLKGILVLTGDLISSNAEQLRALGVDAVCHKPVNIAELLAALEAARGGACTSEDPVLDRDAAAK